MNVRELMAILKAADQKAEVLVRLPDDTYDVAGIDLCDFGSDDPSVEILTSEP